MRDLHPYDGKERRFKHTDHDAELSATGRELVASQLGLERINDARQLAYDLSFYSGGTGVTDRLFIRYECPHEEAQSMIHRLGFIDAAELLQEPEAGKEIAWLVCDDENASLDVLQGCLRRFVIDEKAPFQCDPPQDLRVYFERWSNVNAWTAIYVGANAVNYLAFDQG